jgi:predicted permease
LDTDKLLEILRITFPVFALLGLGNILSRMGKMTDGHQAFLNWLVYYISLPALIFAGMAAQPFSSLLNLDFIIATTGAMLLIFSIYVLIAAAMRLEKKFAAVLIFTTYWSNVAYMGFPLGESAFGERGFLFAAIVNAVSMPVLVCVTFVMIGLCAGDKTKGGVLKSVRGAVINPIILASAAGLLWAWAADILGLAGVEGTAKLPGILRETLGIGEKVLTNVGTMGLSLALLAIGGKLRFRSFGKNVPALALSVAGKLLILPLITLFIMRYFFPAADKDAVGSAVLLMTMPSAVTGAVIAAKFKLNEEFVSAVLATSMLCSVVMIPVWLYVVL